MKYFIYITTFLFCSFFILDSIFYKKNLIKTEFNNLSLSTFSDSSSVVIVFPSNYELKFPIISKSFKDYLSSSYLNNIPSLKINIFLDKSLIDKPNSYYKISTHHDKVDISSGSIEGIHNGIYSFIKISKEYFPTLPENVFEDSSFFENRALHLVIRKDSIQKLYSYIDSARFYNFNKIIFRISNNIDLKSFENEKSNNDKLSLLDFKDFLNYIKHSGLEAIPEVKLLTKQSKTFSKLYPDLMYNKETYDPRNEDIYSKVYSLIDEVIQLTDCSIFHIGHDELYGISNKMKNNNIDVLPPDLFSYDINILYNYLKNKGIRTMMWGDMLWSRKEFPNIRGHKYNMDGYDLVLNEISTEIIICDWHYKSKYIVFPTFSSFINKGFEVWGATWDDLDVSDNFLSYIRKENLKKDSGMIATTWNSDDQTVFNIINNMGKDFWHD